MFAKCIDPTGVTLKKLCPFLVIQEEVTKSISSKTTTIQKFRECQGPKCAAYDNGYCLRLRKE